MRFPFSRKTTHGVKGTPKLSDECPSVCDARPVLFVDVDGVISLFGFDPSGGLPGSFIAVDGILHCIATEVGPRLARLAERYELVWATGWEEKANEYLPQLLGIPSNLPTLTFGGRAVFGTAHWKLGPIGEYAGNRPAAWIDDSLDERCTTWARERNAPTLLVETDPAIGLTDEQVKRLLRFADEEAPAAT